MKNQSSPLKSKSRLIACAVFSSAFLPASLWAASDAFATSVLDDSPYAYYRLGEVSGTAAGDSSGNARNGTYVNGPVLGAAGAGAGDTAVTFDGINDYVNLGVAMQAFGSSLGSFSLELVLKTTTTASGQVIFGMTNNGSGTAFSISTNNSAGGSATANSTRIFFRAESGGSLSVGFVNSALYSGGYAHLVIAFDQTLGAAGFSVYVNGVAQVLTVQSGSGGITSSSAFAAFTGAPTLGANNTRGTVGSYFDGTIDEAAFYVDVLGAGDVAAHYATMIPEPSSVAVLAGLVAVACASRRRRRA